MKTMIYLTVRAKETEELDNKVNESLKKKYQLYGTPYATGDGWICQALVKDDDGRVTKVGF
jgi:hypothetical protein